MSLEKSLSQDISRRQFLKESVKTGLGLAGLLSGCATISFKETAPVIYPPLKGGKIQPPDNGCLIGFYEGTDGSWSVYERATGKKPAIMAAWAGGGGFIRGFPNRYTDHFAKAGVIPFPIAGVLHMDLEEIANGQKDKYIEAFAEGAVKFGQQYGGFFYDPMWEMNIEAKYDIWSWAGHPQQFRKAWTHMWQVFEEKGANKYVTWVLEYHVDHPLEGYYPGDKHVDWIGLSAYNRKVHQKYYGYRYLDDLISAPYTYFRRNHRDKPIMLAEFGTTKGTDQPKWVRKAYQYIKSLPAMKAAIYFDNISSYGGQSWSDNHELSEESLKILKEIFNEPYWIMAK